MRQTRLPSPPAAATASCPIQHAISGLKSTAHAPKYPRSKIRDARCVRRTIVQKIGAGFLSLFRPAVISELCAIVFRRRNLQSLQRPARQSIAPKIQSHCHYFCFGTNFRVRYLAHMSFLRRLKSSTKPEIHNVSQRRQSRRDQCMAIGNMRQFLVTLGHLVLKICSRTDEQA